MTIAEVPREMKSKDSVIASETAEQGATPAPNAFSIHCAKGAFPAFKEIVLPKLKGFEVYHEPNVGDKKGRHLYRIEDKPAIESILNECKITATYKECFDAHFNKPRAERIADNENTRLRAKILRYMEMELAIDADEIKLNSDIASTENKEEDPAVIAARKRIAEKRNDAKSLHDEIEQTANGITLLKELGAAPGTETTLPRGFDILGYNRQRNIIIRRNGYLMSIPVRQLCQKELRLLLGPTHAAKTTYDSKALENLIIDRAFAKGIVDDENPIRTGIRRMGDQWLIISGSQAATYCDGRLEMLESPILNNRIVETRGGDWIDWDGLKNCMARDKTELLSSTYFKIQTKVSTFNWKSPSMADYVTAFILLSPFQHAMDWRPWLWLSGAKSTGKTTFFDEVLKGIYGQLAEVLGKTTAYTIAQTVGNTGAIPILDEAEKNKHLPDVLETLKLCNGRNGVKSSGTTADSPHRFELYHIPWLGSIYQPARTAGDAAQKSRTICFSMKKLPPDIKPFEPFGATEGKKIATQIVAAMLMNWELIEKYQKEIKAQQAEILKGRQGMTIRSLENYMYASAVLNVIHQEGHYTIPEWAEAETEDDCDTVLNAILGSKVEFENEKQSVAALLEQVCLSPAKSELDRVLWTNGLTIITAEGKKYLAVLCDTVTRFLLPDTGYRGLDIRGPLARLEGAIDGHVVKRNKISHRCVAIPLSYIDPNNLD